MERFRLKPFHILALASLSFLAAGGVSAWTQSAVTDDAPIIDWSQRLNSDSQAIYDTLLENHPGTYDTENPEFRKHLDEGLVLAKQRSATVTDEAGWWWALRAYIASFDDGHMQLNAKIATDFPKQWAGFITHYEGNRQVVGLSSDPKTMPPVGAELLGCDGQSTEKLAEDRIGAFRGRWFLQSQKVTYGDYLLVDLGNPYLTNPESCQFKVGTHTKTYGLNYVPITSDELQAKRRLMKSSRAYSFGDHSVEGGYWISMPGFDAEPDSYDFKALRPMIDGLIAKQDSLRQSGFIVLDLRGNGGGSSSWSQEVAKIVWGEDWVKRNEPDESVSVDWRASKGNTEVIDDYLTDFKANGGAPEVIDWLANASKNMHAALDSGKPYWNENNPAPDKKTVSAAKPLFKGKVFILTDHSCASACLDAVDYWKAMGGIQVGTETGADTFYMEIRPQILPSEAAEIYFPMKVYRGRTRGNIETQKPDFAFGGDITDDAAILAWLKGLEISH